MQDKFRTIVEVKKSDVQLNHKSGVLLMGSCFAQNIGNKLADLKFDSISNPFGISYNPLSIHKNICCTTSTVTDVHEKEGTFFSYDLHSELNSDSKENFTLQLNEAIQKQEHSLKIGNTIIISYGTAWVYELAESNQIVNNCHKQPTQQFRKRLLSVQEVVNSWETTQEYLSTNYPEKKIIFTISPVRHLKDGFKENQLSKSILHLAVEEICASQKNCQYFPAFELLMDDLRDYRFYEDDFLHPNQLAVNYIWKKFSETYFDSATISTNQQIEKFNASLQHRAFQPDSIQHQKFLLNLKSKIKAFQLVHDLNFQTEISFIKSQLIAIK